MIFLSSAAFIDFLNRVPDTPLTRASHSFHVLSVLTVPFTMLTYEYAGPVAAFLPAFFFEEFADEAAESDRLVPCSYFSSVPLYKSISVSSAKDVAITSQRSFRECPACPLTSFHEIFTPSSARTSTVSESFSRYRGSKLPASARRSNSSASSRAPIW